MQCPHCSRLFPSGKRSLQCHIRFAHKLQGTFEDIHSRLFLQHDDEQQPIDEIFTNTLEDVPTDLHIDLEDKYLRFQRALVAKVAVQAREQALSRVKLTDGSYSTQASKRVYMLILVYVSCRPLVSESDATDLIRLLKDITGEDGHEIPLPSR